MKHLATKERRMDREEFVYLHKANIKQKELMIKLARKELGYSCRTADCDIYTSLCKTFNKLLLQ